MRFENEKTALSYLCYDQELSGNELGSPLISDMSMYVVNMEFTSAVGQISRRRKLQLVNGGLENSRTERRTSPGIPLAQTYSAYYKHIIYIN